MKPLQKQLLRAEICEILEKPYFSDMSLYDTACRVAEHVERREEVLQARIAELEKQIEDIKEQAGADSWHEARMRDCGTN